VRGAGRPASLCLLLALALPTAARSLPGQAPAAEPPFTLLVMDPLAAPLACACVEGYAQRDYLALGAWLEQRLGEPVRTVHCESLVRALREKTAGRVDLVIGKHSVVQHDAHRAGLVVMALASMGGSDGATTQNGLVVVRAADPAQALADLRGYRILFGQRECEEKHGAARALLRRAGVPLPAPLETSVSCSTAATTLIGLGDVRAAAVISSYCLPLLEGCGTVEAGALRVLAATAPVPFVAAFATDRVPAARQAKLREALLAGAEDPGLLAALQTANGFVDYEPRRPPADPEAFGGWRGPRRDGHVEWLPDRLPAEPQVVWQRELSGAGLAGVAATAQHVIVADRDGLDSQDVWRCLDAATGAELWTLAYAAPGEFDYGNSPRAAPQLAGDRVFLLGACGHLHCVALATGAVRWSRDLVADFQVAPPTWGYCAAPLLVDDLLVVAPGAEAASLVGLDAATGEPRWQTAGAGAAYASFVCATFGGRRQLVGYDADSLGGWDPATGERLWRLAPPAPGDFNVPTPLAVDGRLLVASENNGTRLYDFAADGTIRPEPVASYADLAPDTSTPVRVGERLFGCHASLYCLALDGGLRPLWIGEDEIFAEYASLLASEDRVLVTTLRGELLLLDATANGYRLLGRLPAFTGRDEVWSSPALVGDRLYVRGAGSVRCLRLSDR
jgi:outer membrane protein assembly factor BamB/ABC-type phosphate/phosphonate transport system substrate-binding protein